MSTAHANSPRDLLSRLETMALMSDVDLPVTHVREQIAGALDLIVHMARLTDGRRAIGRISALEGLRAGSVLLQDVFVWARGPDEGFHAAGVMPSILRLLEERDERVDPRIFSALAHPTPASDGGDALARGEVRRPQEARQERSIRTRSDEGRARPPWPGTLRALGGVFE